MNDDMREKLSAYLDEALSAAERRDLESRLAASSELRRELESLRAVSQAVKALPRSPLPAGYLARLQARRARGGAERRDWVLLPPSYRPVAFALSSAVVAIAVWDQFDRIEAPLDIPYAAVKVVPKAEAPVAQVDLSGRITAAGAGAAAPLSAPGRPMEFAEDSSPAKGAGAAAMSEEEMSTRPKSLNPGVSTNSPPPGKA